MQEIEPVDIYVQEDHYPDGEPTQDVHINGNSYPSLEFVFPPGHWRAELIEAEGYLTEWEDE